MIHNALQRGLIIPEEFDFHRLGRTFEVANHVLQNLGELNNHAGGALLDLRAKIADHFARAAVALGARLHFHQNVAAILLGDKQAQLGSRAARK